MKAVIKRALPLAPLPATHEYRAKPVPPEGWERQKAAEKRRKAWEKTMQQKRKAGGKATAKKTAQDCVRPKFHVWTDAERDYLVRRRAAGRSWQELADEFGVSKGAVRIQATRGRAG